MQNIKLGFISVLIFLVLPLMVSAEDFDGSKPLICAIVEIAECTPGSGDCLKGIPDEYNFPQFIKIDFKEKSLTGKAKNQQMLSSPIEKIEIQNGNLLLQGSQSGRAWSMVISQTTGEMTGTVAADGFSFAVFGACIVQ